MKIVILARESTQVNFFVNNFQHIYNITTVFIERPLLPKENSFKKRFKKLFSPKAILNLIISKLRAIRINNLHKKSNFIYFGEENISLEKKYKNIEYYSDINDAEIGDKVELIAPTLIISYGTSIIKNKKLLSHKQLINIHWGLSPYYKGSYCTEWAFLNYDFKNIGLTIHKTTSNIDGGDIILQKRIHIEENDTIISVNNKIAVQALIMMNEVVNKIISDKTLNTKVQDTKIGRLYLAKHYNMHISNYIYKINIQEIKRQKCIMNELPIIEYL